MARGRKFVPPPDAEGFWFTHQGADNHSAGKSRSQLTSTGQMLSAPFSTTASTHPKPPPPRYNHLAQTTYRTVHPFSAQADRNDIQSYGEYFGDGRVTRFLGRKLLEPLHSRLHFTKADFLMHHSRQPTVFSYDSETASNYTGKPLEDLPSLNAHRYPKTREERRALPTSTADWGPDTPRSLGSIKAATAVLALTQSVTPRQKYSPWKYSYKSLPTLYPPSLYRKTKDLDNVLKHCEATFRPVTHN